MVYILTGFTAVIIVAALAYFFKHDKKEKSTSSVSVKRSSVKCPLCGSSLAPGENLSSRIYRPMTVPDQRCTISGCPHCYPVCEPGLRRICPVCGKPVPQNGYLIARLFNKTDGKKHILVTGCSECSKHIVP